MSLYYYYYYYYYKKNTPPGCAESQSVYKSTVWQHPDCDSKFPTRQRSSTASERACLIPSCPKNRYPDFNFAI